MVFTYGEENAPIRFIVKAWLNEFEEASIIDGATFVDSYSHRLPSDVSASDAIKVFHDLEPDFILRLPTWPGRITGMFGVCEFF
jgi:hypothetical protein